MSKRKTLIGFLQPSEVDVEMAEDRHISDADLAALELWHRRQFARRVGRSLAEIPRGATVHHLDGNPYNLHPDNLRVVDPRENSEQR